VFLDCPMDRLSLSIVRRVSSFFGAPAAHGETSVSGKASDSGSDDLGLRK